MNSIAFLDNQVQLGAMECPNCGEIYAKATALSGKDYNYDVAHPISITHEPCRICGIPLLRFTGRWVELVIADELFPRQRGSSLDATRAGLG